MKYFETEINSVYIIEPKVFEDSRGYFFESFRQDLFNEKINPVNFVQANESKSSFGILRGIHFQKEPYVQSKLVRVVKGEVQDVAVDLRKDSPTFGKYVSVILSGDNKKQLFMPQGFGHAFLSLSDEVIFSYNVDNYYSKNHDSGIIYNDPDLNIHWELDEKDIKVSDKDKKLISFSEYKESI